MEVTLLKTESELEKLLDYLIETSKEIGYWGDVHDIDNQAIKDEHDKLLKQQAELKQAILSRDTLYREALRKTLDITRQDGTVTIYGAIADAMHAAERALAQGD